MKRLIIISVLMALTLVGGGIGALSHGQSPAPDLKPTFISPTRGLYVSGWPPFTVSYPEEWVEVPPLPGEVYRAERTRPDIPPGLRTPVIAVGILPNRLPLEEWAKAIPPIWKRMSADYRVLYDRPSLLKDGTPAREVEIEFVPTKDPALSSLKSVPKRNIFYLMTKKESTLVFVGFIDDRGEIGKDLKEYAYSLTFNHGGEGPAQVPADVREFLAMYCVDLVSGDISTIMTHWSDRFFHWGVKKAFFEGWFRNDPNAPTRNGITSCEPTVTVFEPHGDRAYLDGFWTIQGKGDQAALRTPLNLRQIVKEHGQWKWFGNQR